MLLTFQLRIFCLSVAYGKQRLKTHFVLSGPGTLSYSLKEKRKVGISDKLGHVARVGKL
jgi:hypothetical protein